MPDTFKYELYQIKTESEARPIAFMAYDYARSKNLTDVIRKNNYNKVYAGTIKSNSDTAALDELFTIFNINHPEDFRGHSLSISDVIVLNNTPYYIDPIGFQELSEF